MARQKSVIPTVEKKVMIYANLCARMELELYSEIEGKIPYGAQSLLINELLRKHYATMDAAIACAIKSPQIASDAYPEFKISEPELLQEIIEDKLANL